MDGANTSPNCRKIPFPESKRAHGIDGGVGVVVGLEREDVKLESHLNGLGRGFGVVLLDHEVKANPGNI
jgi:hypothetical protein